MCVCMAVESIEVNGNSDLIGKENRKKEEIIKVYTRKNKRAKFLDASSEEPSISAVSANGEPSPSSSPVKNHSCRDDGVKNSEQQHLDEGLKGKGSNLEIKKVQNESGGGEEFAADVLGEKLPSIVKAVEDSTLISHGVQTGHQVYGSCQSEKFDEPVRNSNPEVEPRVDSSGREEPSAGEVLKGGFLERQPNGGGEPVFDCSLGLLSNDDQETNPIHGIEPRSDHALESTGRGVLQPSSCNAHVSNNTEDLRQLPNGTGVLPPGGGQLRLLSGTPQPHPFGQENHQVLDNLESGLSKPLVSMAEDRLYIALCGSSSKDEMQSLKRKLEIELDQVRRVARKVDEKEHQVSAYTAKNMINPAGFLGSVPRISSVYPQPHLTRVSSSVESFGHPDSSRHLSVSVMDNNHVVADLVEKEKSTPSVFYQPHLTRVDTSLCSVGHPEIRPYRNSTVTVTENNHDAVEFVDREKRTPKANSYYTNSDFYLEKDKLPPESHKKMPKVPSAGKKHGFGGEYGVAFCFGTDKDGNKLFRDCSNLLQRLMKHKHGWVFDSPVDPIKFGIHDYNDVIKHPMDLGTIKSRLTQNQYNSAMEFAGDVRLVFSNAMTYNPKGHEVHTMAEELSTIFEDRWGSIEKGYFQKKMHNKAGFFSGKRKDYVPPALLNPVIIPAPAQFTPPVRTLDRSVVRPANNKNSRVSRARTPALQKPKANDLNKRDMTFDEKQKLSSNLQNLPTDRLDAIVQIIKKRSTALSQHDDEIEVDIDNVDPETLWELDRFVSNFKKSLSKYRRKAELLAQQARDAAAQAIQKTDPVPADLVSQKESTIGGENVNIAPIQVEDHTNKSASSSSSSSSSDSGSSSSDSDSDSSSADGLDAGRSPGA